MRQCPKCSVQFPISEFDRRGKGYCKKCRHDYMMTWNKLNLEKRRGYQKSRVARASEVLSRIVAERGNCCEHCGKSYPSQVYDWHHVGPKRFAVSVMRAAGHSEQELRDETANCKLLCCLCHRMHHAGIINVT